MASDSKNVLQRGLENIVESGPWALDGDKFRFWAESRTKSPERGARAAAGRLLLLPRYDLFLKNLSMERSVEKKLVAKIDLFSTT